MIDHIIPYDRLYNLINLERDARILYGDMMVGISANSREVIFHMTKEVSFSNLREILENHNPVDEKIPEKTLEERISFLETEVENIKKSRT